MKFTELCSCILEQFRYKYLDPWRYKEGNDYDAERYWKDRFSRFGMNLRGVGCATLPRKVNKEIYQEARKVFLKFCSKEGISFKNTRMLDIGCGNGFYAQAFLENGGKNYLGIDITDVLFPELNRRFPEFQFKRADVSSQELEGEFDLIIMIDVTQHITNQAEFHFAMQNIKTHLSKDGVFVVTSYLSEKLRRYSFCNFSRTLNTYRREFLHYLLSEPVPFRDKFIFSIKRRRLI